MKENRFSYLIISLAIIITGLLSRKIDFIPLFVGDFLYAILIYFLIRFLLITLDRKKAAIIALLICYGIELLQLYNTEWIIELRGTVFGRFVLGEGFLWSDIAAYSLGVLFAYCTEKTINQ